MYSVTFPMALVIPSMASLLLFGSVKRAISYLYSVMEERQSFLSFVILSSLSLKSPISFAWSSFSVTC